MNSYGIYGKPSFFGPSPTRNPLPPKNDGSVVINGKIFRPVAQGKTCDAPTPMNEDFEKEYSYRLALSKPFFEKLAEMIGSQVLETTCVCGTDKRKRLVVHFSNVPAMLICGERAKAGHKVPDSLKAAASYMAFFHKMTSFELIPPGVYDLACRKQNVAACLDILVPFMSPTMEKLKNMLQRAEIKNTNFEPLGASIGEKDTQRAQLCSRLQTEWGLWAKTYWTPLEQKLTEDIQAVPQGNDHVPYVRKTEEEIALSREQSRLMGEQHNVSEASKKRKSPLDGPPSRFGPSARRTQIKHIETISPPFVTSDYLHPYTRSFEPPAHSYNHGPTPPPPPPPPPPEPYRRTPLLSEPPRTRYNFFPAPPSRKPLLPTPGMPPYHMIDHRRADFVHNEIKYLVGMFEERFINPDGTRFPIMDSPIVQRALNLDYTSLPDAEHILSSLQKAWTELSTNNTHDTNSYSLSNSNLLMFSGLTYHRLRPGEEVREGQQALWNRTGSDDFCPVTISRVKLQKAVIDFDDDMEIVQLKDLYFLGY